MDFAPDPPLEPPVLAAVEAALLELVREREATPPGYASAWRRAAARESVENEWKPATAALARRDGGYALSPRSTRGASRA